ncbi:MAG: nickel/cobalt transporter [Pseudomonadota bacterium]
MIEGILRKPVATGAIVALVLGLTAVVLLIDLPAAWQKTVIYAIQMQRELHRDLATAMRAVEQAGPAAHWTLISLGFLYGLFHAIGPGHGKVVISTYLATHESRLGQGLLLSFLSSLMQGVTAITVVGVTALVLERSLRSSQETGIALEVLSYGLVSLIGVFLMWRSGRYLFRRSASSHDHVHDHAHGHDHCHHCHGPSASDLSKPLTLREIGVMILSVGLRPCSGAIIVLILAFATGLIWAGIAAVVAMSIGTGLAVAALATLSVYARRSALAFADMLSMHEQKPARLLHAVAFIGGLLIAFFGATLLKASLTISNHPLF